MNPTPSPWLTSEDLARRYGVPVATVRKWRLDGTGPKAVKFGRYVRYELEECERWEREKAAQAV